MELERQVADTERACARSMAERDHAAFKSFLSVQACFFGGGEVLRGKAAVAAGAPGVWRVIFDKGQPPDAPPTAP